ncbi:UNVERIFIED_CONTAM: hypothetical protein Sangu_2817100 [Sesamum angustifolium]|uniref:Uncharacterized protein n=1 Tax=Sesamum angustifolium TaxID=2727405 RepID=A0AAW2IR52_9LAMI
MVSSGACTMGVGTSIGLLGQRHVFPVAEGGLGVQSLVDYVRAFSIKLWWQFRSKSYGRNTCMVATVKIYIRLLCLIIVIIPRFGIASVTFEMLRSLFSSRP